MQLTTLVTVEFKRLIRSRGLWLTALVVLLTGMVIGTPQPEVAAALGSTAVIAGFQIPVSLFGGLAGLLASYRAISYERESGRLLLLAGLPFTRSQIVVGKMIGRTAAVAVPTLLAVCVGYIAGALDGRVASPAVLLGFLLLSVIYLAVTVGVGIGLSSLVRSSTVSVTGIIGYFIVLTAGWVDLLSIPVYSTLTGRGVIYTDPPADIGLFLLQRATPAGAFSLATNWLFGIANSSASFNSAMLQVLPRVQTNALLVRNAFGGDTPFLLAEPLVFVVFALWLIVPVGLGIAVFKRGDLL